MNDIQILGYREISYLILVVKMKDHKESESPRIPEAFRYSLLKIHPHSDCEIETSFPSRHRDHLKGARKSH